MGIEEGELLLAKHPVERVVDVEDDRGRWQGGRQRIATRARCRQNRDGRGWRGRLHREQFLRRRRVRKTSDLRTAFCKAPTKLPNSYTVTPQRRRVYHLVRTSRIPIFR